MGLKEAAVPMRTTNYASILGAVGSVLDLAEARSFTVRESDDGLTLDILDGRGERHSFELSVADVAELLTWAKRSESHPKGAVAAGRDEGALRAFLERHTLVGAH